MKKPFQQETAFSAADSEELLTDAPVSPPTTGTIDDEDDPADERADENEAPVREKNDKIKASQEFQHDDDDFGTGDE
jgi:hypothetical protein